MSEREYRHMGISARIVADSVYSGKRISTYELVYPRFVHAELMTHRLFSRNAASSRAIPTMKKIKMIWKNPAMPVHWGQNKPGMQADTEMTGWKKTLSKFVWRTASKVACGFSYLMFKMGVHKQIVNRMLEPFEWYKVLVTATEFDNWFWLRCHKDAQPEIQTLAKLMYQAKQEEKPFKLRQGEWHLPYVNASRGSDKKIGYYVNGEEISLEDAIKVSTSCCAQISYRVNDNSLKKANMIFEKLIESVPVHASPTEHQATPLIKRMQKGVTHHDRNGAAWSGNFKGWIQHRQLLDNEHTCWNYESAYSRYSKEDPV